MAATEVSDPPPSPEQMDRDTVLASLGYKSAARIPWKAAEIQEKSLCRRCGKKVYPVEKLDIGVLYHKGCFKCRQCGVTLTLKSFNRELDAQSNTKEVYCSQHVPKHHYSFDTDALEIQNALKAQRKATRKGVNTVELEEGWTYDQTEALGYQKLMRRKSGRKLKRRSTLRSFRDFEKYGVFDAQDALEKVHKEEEDELYKEIFEDRKQQVQVLEKCLRTERETTVKELIQWFDEKNANQTERQQGLQKVELYFRREREARVRGLLQQLALEEQAAVTRMVEKHAQEMLALIAQKDQEAYRDIRRRSKEPNMDGLSEHSLDYILNSTDEEGLEEETEEEEGDEQEDRGESREEGEAEGLGRKHHQEEEQEEQENQDQGSEGHGQNVGQSAKDNTGAEVDLSSDDDDYNVEGSADIRNKEEEEEESDEDKENYQESEHTTDTAITRRNMQGNRPSNDFDHDVDEALHHVKRTTKHGGSHGRTHSPAMQKLHDKLDQSIQKDSPKVAPGGSNYSIQRVRVAKGGGGDGTEKSTPVVSDQGQGQGQVGGGESFDNVPHAHGHVSRSPYSRRRGQKLRNEWDNGDSDNEEEEKRAASPYRRRIPQGHAPTPPVLQIHRPPGREASPRGKTPMSGKTPKTTMNKNTSRTATPDRGTQKQTQPQKHKTPQGKTLSASSQGLSTPPSHRAGSRQPPHSQSTPGLHVTPQGTPGKRTPAYEINIMVPGNRPKVQVGHGAPQEESSEEDSEEYSSSGEEEGEYNTKAAGVLLRHPADDSKMVISDSELPPRIHKSSNSSTSSSSSDPCNRPHDPTYGGRVRTVSMIGTGATAAGGLLAVPVVVPAQGRKSTLYESEKVFEEFDNQAIQEAKKDHKTFTELVRKLSKKCQTELQKVRALFRWITVKDLNKLDLDGPLAPDSPMLLLRGIKSGKETYHTLFKRLCSYAGLHCVIIDGFSKGAGYRPGAKLTGGSTTFRNQWTAVNVEGSWRFINCNWGARHVKGPNDAALTYKCDEFYFLTDAEDHIYQHFPDDEEWQLLEKSITLDEFTRLPVTKSPFYNKRLHFAYKYPAVLGASDGQAEVRITMPKFMGFAAKLHQKDGRVPAEMLSERVLVRVVENDVAIAVNLPMPGVYYLDVFVESDWRKNLMDHACAFAIKCSGVSKDAHVSYPPGLGMFGRTARLRDMGLAESERQTDPYVTCRQTAEITFDASREEQLKLSHTFQLWSYRDRALQDAERFAILRKRSDGVATFLLRCTQKGHYVFTVLAEDSSSESGPEVVYRAIVDCRVAGEDLRPFPRVSKRWQHCLLIEPLQGDLPLDAQVVFRFESARATEIVVVIAGVWHALQRSGGGDNIWQGVVPTGKQHGKAIVYAKFAAGKSKYIPCLEYNIVSLSKYSFV